MEIKNIFKIAGLTALSFITGGISTLYDFEPKTINFKDIDEDGRDDIIISTRKNNAAYVLLERDGSYIRLEALPEAERENIRKTVYDNMANLNGFRMER